MDGEKWIYEQRALTFSLNIQLRQGKLQFLTTKELLLLAQLTAY